MAHRSLRRQRILKKEYSSVTGVALVLREQRGGNLLTDHVMSGVQEACDAGMIPFFEGSRLTG